MNHEKLNTLILTVAYDELTEDFHERLKHVITNNYPLIQFISYHENKLKERKKALGFKGSYGARKTPFVALSFENRTPLKAFYTEVKDCTIDNIIDYINSWILFTDNVVIVNKDSHENTNN